MFRDERRDRLRPGPARILATVPLGRADRREEVLHRGFVAVEQRPVQVARVPVDQDAAEVEDDSRDGWAVDRMAGFGLPQPARSRTNIGITRSVFLG